MTKRLLIPLLAVLMLYTVACFVRYYRLPPEVQAQTNTFCAANLTCTVTAAWIMNGAATTITNLNSTVVCDGTKYATIQAAAAALPVTGGEVIVPSASTCTWNGAGMTGSVSVRFLSAAASYAVTAPIIMTNGANHLICQAGQGIGGSGQNNTGFVNAGTVLNFTGNLTGSQDAISAVSTNGNDGNTVEGCYIKMGGSGRAAIHFSGENGSRVQNVVVADPGSYGWWLDGSSTTLAHAYGNQVIAMDVIHSGLEAYRLETDPARTGTGGDIDRTTLINIEQHPRDIATGISSSGFGVHLLVPSTALTTQTIANTYIVNLISNGTASPGYGIKLENAHSSPTAMIPGVTINVAELEDAYVGLNGQPNPNAGTALLISTIAQTDIDHLSVVGGGLIGPNYATQNNINPPIYGTGTATFTNNSTTLTGSGTTWTQAMVGDIVTCTSGACNGSTATVGVFNSTTSITLSNPFTGGTQAGATYTIGGNNVNGLMYQNGFPAVNTHFPSLFDVISFQNNYSAAVSCTGSNVSPGIRFGVSQPSASLLYTADNTLHYYRCDTAVDQWKVDLGNTRIIPNTTNTWRLGDHTVPASWTEMSAYGFFWPETTAPTASGTNDICYGDSTLHALKCSYNNGTFFQIPQVITATSAAFATATTAGTCVQNTTSVAGATTSMAVSVSPVSTPGVGAVWSAFVSSVGNVTINECAVATSAGGTIAFNIRVFP